VRTVSVNTIHWFDASSSEVIHSPMNNFITLITSTVAGLHFCCADSICVALQISEQFSPKTKTSAHWMMSSDQILTQSDHSRSFKVIRFGVNEEPPRGYIVQYNIVALNVKVRKI